MARQIEKSAQPDEARVGRVRLRLAFALINLGVRLLPPKWRTDAFVRNCMITGHIRVRQVCGAGRNGKNRFTSAKSGALRGV